MRRQFDTPSPDGLPANDREDARLLERITQRDREAFHDLYTRYYHPLLRFIYRMTGDLDAAQEGINDVMFTVWRKSGSFAGRSKVSTWILGIAYHKALKHLQKGRLWAERFKAAELTDSIELSSDLAALTDNRDLEDLLEHGMRALPAKHRATVELTYVYGCSYEEIAAIMDCPVNTVKTRMFHAREKLRKVLGDLDKGSGAA
jgi:RNA polymerase sigma-70 factor (ECF subfamily)